MTLTVGRLASEQIEARVNRFVIIVREGKASFTFIFLVSRGSCHVDPQLILVSRRCRDCLLSVFFLFLVFNVILNIVFARLVFTRRYAFSIIQLFRISAKTSAQLNHVYLIFIFMMIW